MPAEPATPVLQTLVSPPLNEVVSLVIGATFSEVERELVLQTIIHCNGNRTHAARVLGMSVRTIRNKIREYSAMGYLTPIDKQG